MKYLYKVIFQLPDRIEDQYRHITKYVNGNNPDDACVNAWIEIEYFWDSIEELKLVKCIKM